LTSFATFGFLYRECRKLSEFFCRFGLKRGELRVVWTEIPAKVLFYLRKVLILGPQIVEQKGPRPLYW